MNDSPQPALDSEATDGRYSVIARRYRPQTFDELVGQEHVATALKQAIASGRVGHAYLFTGARGVGKTSAARILAKALNCEHGPTATPCNQCDTCRHVATGDDIDVLEIDGASNRRIEEARQIRQNVAVRPSRSRFKIYIIDEVHMLVNEAFNALLKTLEEPPPHVKFIFATTEPQKIPITILSRCQRFDFAGVNAKSIQERLAQIAAAEGVEVEPEALQILASRATGPMRDSQSLLEQLLAVGHRQISATDVNQLLGIAPAERLNSLVQHLIACNASAALAELDAAIQGGVEVGLLLDQLVGYFRDVMTTAVGCGPDQMLYALPTHAEEVAQVGRQLGLPAVLAIAQILDHACARLRVSMHARTLVEVALVRICQLGEMDDLATLVAELRGSGGATPAPGKPSATSAPQHIGSMQAALQAQFELKKNAELRPTPPSTAAQATVLPVREVEATAVVATAEPPRPIAPPAPVAATASTEVVRRLDTPHAHETPAIETNEQPEPVNDRESVIAKFKQAMANGGQPKENLATSSRVSRREQLAQVAEQPFVRRAMELFEVATDKLKYTPPGSKSS